MYGGCSVTGGVRARSVVVEIWVVGFAFCRDVLLFRCWIVGEEYVLEIKWLFFNGSV